MRGGKVSMSTDFHVIEFPLEEGLAPIDFEFLPHGTRTLKIKVTNPDPAKNNKK
jgi:hypothetical protein